MQNKTPFFVLITDVRTRKSFDLANILRHNNIPIILCDAVDGIQKRILERAYGTKLHTLRKGEQFDRDLESILAQYAKERVVYIPIEEDTTVMVYAFLQAHPDVTNLCYNLPPQEAFDTVRDKGAFGEFCIAHGLPVPKMYRYAELIEMEQLPGPLIVKPRRGSGAVGIRFVDTKEQLKQLENLPWDAYIIQERLENPQAVEGGFFLFDQGRICSYYGHKRLRTYPPRAGVSIYSKCDLNPDHQALGEALLQKLGWSGIAMVEFLYDPAQKCYKIIEVNPRLWGSLLLSEFCGAKIIENYCNLALGLPPETVNINPDTYIRWFFPWELLGYVQSGFKIKKFWSFNRRQTCYINATYATVDGAILFTLSSMVDPAKLKKLFSKVFTR